MWRKGFTFKVQTPHLKFGSWNDSRLSTVFWCGSNQKFFGYVEVQLSKGQLARGCYCLRYSASKVCIMPSTGSKWMTRHHGRRVSFFWTTRHHNHTCVMFRRTVSPLTNWPLSVPSCRKGRSHSALLCLVWFSIWFGIFKVATLCFWLFVCLFVLPRQSVSLSNKNLEAKFSQYFFQPPDKNL